MTAPATPGEGRPLTDEELAHAVQPLRALAKHGAASAPTLYQDQAQIIIAAFDTLTARALAAEQRATRAEELLQATRERHAECDQIVGVLGRKLTRAEGVVEAARELELTLRNTWFLCGRAGGKSLLADAWRSTADAVATYDQEDRK